MPVEPLPTARFGLRRLFDAGAGAVAASTEGQLLARFVATRDELAFEAIVARHGPMVLGVCRSVLTDPSAVDDAFQATFLILVQRAGSFRAGAPLGPWLHGIARRVARRAWADAAKRYRRESANPDFIAAAPDRPTRTTADRELAALLHAEVDRLPSSERAAILLCDLEGFSHQEAADELGWPLGTVKTRVARGRDRLRARLTRRGVALSAPALVATLAGESVAAAALTRALVVITTRGAVALAAAGRVLAVGLVSPSVLALTQGAIHAMIWTKIKAGTLALAATTVLAVPPLVAYQDTPRADPKPAGPAVVPPKPVVKAPAPVPQAGGKPASQGEIDGDLPSRMVQMAQARLTAIALEERDKMPVDLSVKLLWSRRLADAEVAGAPTPEGRLRAVRSYLDRLQAQAANQAGEVADLLATTGKAASTDSSSGSLFASWWKSSEEIEAALKDARRWQAQLQEKPATPTPPTGNGLAGREFGGVFSNGRATNEDLSAPRLPLDSPADEKQNEAILAILERRIPMNFSGETPLGALVQYVQQATADKAADFPAGIPIYVDPGELREAEQTMTSTIALNLEGVALKTSLHLALKQIKMTYIVENGLLIVVAANGGDYDHIVHPKPGFGGGFQ